MIKNCQKNANLPFLCVVCITSVSPHSVRVVHSLGKLPRKIGLAMSKWTINLVHFCLVGNNAKIVQHSCKKNGVKYKIITIIKKIEEGIIYFPKK